MLLHVTCHPLDTQPKGSRVPGTPKHNWKQGELRSGRGKLLLSCSCSDLSLKDTDIFTTEALLC